MNFSIGDLLVFNLNEDDLRKYNYNRKNMARNGIITSIDGERIGVRWTGYDGQSVKNHHTWDYLSELIDRKTIEWYPV